MYRRSVLFQETPEGREVLLGEELCELFPRHPGVVVVFGMVVQLGHPLLVGGLEVECLHVAGLTVVLVLGVTLRKGLALRCHGGEADMGDGPVVGGEGLEESDETLLGRLVLLDDGLGGEVPGLGTLVSDYEVDSPAGGVLDGVVVTHTVVHLLEVLGVFRVVTVRLVLLLDHVGELVVVVGLVVVVQRVALVHLTQTARHGGVDVVLLHDHVSGLLVLHLLGREGQEDRRPGDDQAEVQTLVVQTQLGPQLFFFEFLEEVPRHLFLDFLVLLGSEGLGAEACFQDIEHSNVYIIE